MWESPAGDEVYPAYSVMAEEVCASALMQPLYALPDGRLHLPACFLW